MGAKEKIQNAVLALLEEKRDFSSISVSDIVRAAGVHRSTFYYHFYDPSDIFCDMLASFMDDYADIADKLGSGNHESAPLLICTHFYNNRRLVSAALRSSFRESFCQQVVRTYVEMFRLVDVWIRDPETGKTCIFPHDDKFEFYLYSTGYAFLGRMIWWAERGFFESPEALLRYSFDITSMDISSLNRPL